MIFSETTCSAVDAVVNFATTGAQGFQLSSEWGNLTSFTKSLGTASIALLTVTEMINVKTFFLTQDKLKDLRKHLSEAIQANHLREILDDLHDGAKQVIDL